MHVRAVLLLAGVFGLGLSVAAENPYQRPTPEPCPQDEPDAGCSRGELSPPDYITPPTNATVAIDTTESQMVTVGDPGGTATVIYMTASSSNQTAIPNADLVINGGASNSCMISGGQCNITVAATPRALPMSNPVIVTLTICETDPGFGSCSGALANHFWQISVTPGSSPCTFTPSPTSNTVSAGTTATSFDLTVGGDGPCPWNASDNQAWVTNVNPSSGSATGTTQINLTLQTNPTSQSRLATVTIDPQGAGLPNSTFNLTQQGQPCTYDILVNGNPPSAGSPINFDQTGGMGTVEIVTLAGCAWQVDRSPAWISTNPSSGNGPDTIDFTVAANGSGMTRSTDPADPDFNTGDEFDVAAESVFVEQTALNCTYSLSESAFNFGAGSGSDSFNVTVNDPACAWTLSDDRNWISVDDPSGSGTTNGINALVTANAGGLSRSGTISLRDAGNQVVDTLSVNQDGLGCAFSVNPPSANFDDGGGAGGFSFTLNAGCTWSASESVPWITGLSPTGGTGNGNLINVGYNVAVNPTTTARATTIQVNSIGANGTHMVNQAGDCDITLSALVLNFDQNAGSQMITLTNPTSCDWGVSESIPWVTIMPGSGSAGATLTVDVTENPGNNPRSGMAQIGDETVTINQDPQPLCDPMLSPALLTPDHTGAAGTVDLTGLDVDCDWTAVSNDAFLMVMPGSGTGNATLNYTVGANDGVSQRTGTATIAGETLTVVQSADVSVVISEVQLAGPDRFELVNRRASSVNLSGLSYLTTGAVQSSGAVPAVTLATGDVVDVEIDPGIWQPGTAGSLAIVDAEGVGVDFLRWAGSGASPPAGTAFSGSVAAPYTDTHVMGRDSAGTDTDDAIDWCLQAPTPLVPNLDVCVINPVLVNEVAADTPDYTELFNFSTDPVDISDWMIESTGGATDLHPIPGGSILGPGGYARIEEFFGTVLPPPDCNFQANPISNCGFESGNFSGWTVTNIFDTYGPDPFNPITLGGQPVVAGPGMVSVDNFGFFLSAPPEGGFVAAHGFDGDSGTMGIDGIIEIAQDVILAPEARTLFFEIRAGWDLFTFCLDCTQDRVFRVEIQPTGGGAPLLSLDMLVLEPETQIFDTGPIIMGFPVSGFAGQSVRIAFVWVVPEPFTGPAFFQIDNISVVGIPPGTLLTGVNFNWVNAGPGSVLLMDDLGDPVDFVRWGTSPTLPPPGTGFTGNAPSPLNVGQVSGRTTLSTDTDQARDWCLQAQSSAQQNPFCDGEILFSSGFEDGD